ncbi:helix-turn-helix domain-containing protein [Oleiagrimonas soli]|uniref:Cytoskeleton protein RodZ n=1 Tax=Oleiagrimonas soli TaxID=1543381 RepID=A0A841KDG3_9GAMM|nr:helix-turn-helix domain-containing protein [Oleiagrimonas soli]MBB6183216.1 cytoskeleton protein RodZ [Oleiagrimonas soli]
MRESRHLALSDCARDLHLPVRLLQKLERDDYEGIDYSVYLRSYLCKYATYLGMDRERVDAQLERLQPRQPELVATQQLSVWQRGLNRYSSAATYVVLTAVIVAPLIWLGLNGVLKRDIARLAPLDAAPVSAQSTELVGAESGTTAQTVSATPVVPAVTDQASSAAPANSEKPLMASMAPFSAMEAAKAKAESADAPVAATAPQASTDTKLTLNLQNDSWVEITDADGKRLEYGLLPAGTRKSYHSAGTLDVRIGNADGASVAVDGKALSLVKFRRANVAHFTVADDGEVQPSNG